MKTEAPEGPPQGEGSGVKVEHTEGSPQGEESESKDEHMGVTEEGEQGIWGKCKTVADPEAAKATKDAQAQNEDAFDNLEKSKDKKGLVDTAEYKEFIDTGGQGNRGEFPDSSYTRVLERAGTDRVRVCAFHLNNIVASKRVSVAHECLASMFADCVHYQVDLIGGDANMALYRAMGSKLLSYL
eukprot:s6932_g6.t1